MARRALTRRSTWIWGGIAAFAMGCTTTGGDKDAGPPPAPTLSVPAITYAAASTQVTITAAVSGGNNPTFHWEQQTGSMVNVAGANTASINISAPAARSDLTFKVTMTDGATTLTGNAALKVRRPTPLSPLPLAAGRSFTYTVREEDYTWMTNVASLHPSDPQPVGTFTMTVSSMETVNGLPIFTLGFAENRTAPVPTCASGQPDATACGSGNFTCVSGTCVTNKPFATMPVTVLQIDDQLLVWRDANTAPLQVVNPAQVLPGGQPAIFDGVELLSAKTRINPQLPETALRFLGATAIGVPGTAPAGSLATQGTMAPTVEIFDGTNRKDTLSPYRTTRAWYIPGTGLAFFQHESVTAEWAPTSKAGYRDAVLTHIDPAP